MRQLAAILFADMTGYTALMQANEQSAVQKRKRFREVLEAYLPECGGKVLQYYGDGCLSIFNSAIAAVKSAVQMQQALRQEPAVAVRMGLHLGDVSVEEDGIFGDGVNLASRIESLAVPGAVFISEKIYDEIRNQSGLEAVEMGYFELKNIQAPVRVFAVNGPGIVVPPREAVKGKTQPPLNRLAVIPFVNMSADPENEYFSDGITEEILNVLTRVTDLQVTSRTSSFAFKGKDEDIREIAAKLNVDKVLEGSVRKAGNRVRITAQLINATDGYHIWSETYDRDLTDIFGVQDEISQKIVRKLHEGLFAGGVKKGQDRPRNLEAYNLFLKGLHFYNKLTPADSRKAIGYFEQAIALEPDYAKPYAYIATACSYLGVTGQMGTKQAFTTAHQYSEKAIQLDPSLAEGYVARGSVCMTYHWRWDDAFGALQQAIQLNPAGTEAYQLLAFYQVIRANPEEAVRLMEEARVIDPLSPTVNHFLGEMYMAAGRYREALQIAELNLDLYPGMRVTLEMKGWATGMLGDWSAALDIFREVHRQIAHPLKGLTPLGFAYGKLGRREEALGCVAKLEERAAIDPNAVMDTDLAMVWWGIGDQERSIEYMFRSVEKRLGTVALYLEAPVFAGLKEHPAYAVLKQKLHLPVPAPEMAG